MLISRLHASVVLIVGLPVALYTPFFVGVPAAVASAAELPPVSLPGSLTNDPQTRDIITKPTLRRHIPAIRFAADRRTYEFLVARPPLAAQLARRLHPSLERYTVTQIGEGLYTVEDRGALRGEVRLVNATDERRIYRFQGEFRSLAYLLRFTGRMVLILRYREVRERGRTYMESDPDFYLRIDHLLFHAMMKLLSPLIHTILDRRVTMIVEATGKLFEQVQNDPKGLYRQMSTWSEVQPADLEAFRHAFVEKEVLVR